MKSIINCFLVFLIAFASIIKGFAQHPAKQSNLELGKVEPFEMEVTYDKTSHVIFPAAIRYVDLGSDNLVAGKAEDTGNVLRVKANKVDFECGTNFSVITEDGNFYSFNVHYNAFPTTLSYDLLKMRKSMEKAVSSTVLFENLDGTPSTLAGLVLETIYEKNQRLIKHIASKSYGIKLSLRGIYTDKGKLYFHIELQNATHSPFRVDFINFKVADKKVGRRTVVQDRPLVPLRSYKPLDDVQGKRAERNVFLLDDFSLAQDKELRIEVYEKHGNRNQVIQVQYSDLLKAKMISEMHLKF